MKVGEEDFTLFRDAEYVPGFVLFGCFLCVMLTLRLGSLPRLRASKLDTK